MKVKTIARSEEDAMRASSRDVVKQHKNPDPKLHPFEKAREYVRAVTAAKMDRMFAKPFMAALSEHSDGVYCSATSPKSLVAFVSGAADGEAIVWDLATQKKLWSVYAHTGFVRGLAVAADGDSFFSCGDDRSVKQWRMAAQEALAAEDAVLHPRLRQSNSSSSASSSSSRRDDSGGSSGVSPVAVWTGKHAFTYLDADPSSARRFATSAGAVDVWDTARSHPLHTYEWGADTVTTVRFNPADPALLASTGADRSVCIYDLRSDTPLRKVTMAMRANALAWNPREPMNFVIASEDSNCYSFDMRALGRALVVHKDHVSAVMDVAWSPTGKEFVTGSYDRTVRIWRADGGKSREVYHTKRMQRVFTVKFTGDAKYVLSGSDDTNIRLWKAQASAQLGRMLPAERDASDYRRTLLKRYAHMPEIKKIETVRHIPRGIVKAKAARFTEEQKVRRKLANVRAHTREDSREGIPEPERKKAIVGERR